jgi:hypothetical protein
MPENNLKTPPDRQNGLRPRYTEPSRTARVGTVERTKVFNA